ncbi:MAG: strawberry notch family protein, partial [Bacteroidota bacterium]
MSKEIPLEVPAFSESEQEIKALLEEEAAFVPYVPKSKGPELGTLIPKNIAFEVRKSLNRVATLKGDIDAYVSNQLRYTSKQQLYKALGAEQIDALGLYLLQFEKNLGIVIADDTGVGKGRQAAAVIRHAIMNDCIPVFLTKDPSLFSDIYRDLVDIDFNQIKPFIINTDQKASVKDQQGNVIFHRMNSKDQKEKLIAKRKVATDSAESVKWHEDRGIPLPDPDEKPTIEIHQVIDYLPDQYNCVFSTYKQIERGGAHKRVWLANMTEAGVEGSQKYKPIVYILDECHLIRGYKTIAGTWARNILPHSKAACFLSGTSAKDPSVLLLYAKKTSMQEAQLEDDVFIRGMNRGGLALQELMPPNLAESGQLIKRQRPSDGILYH